MPGAPVEVVSIGNRIWAATTCVNVSEVIPSARACAKASSRFGPIVPAVPASASVWQTPQAWVKSCFPVPWLPPSEYPPVPHPESASTRRRRADGAHEGGDPHGARVY